MELAQFITEQRCISSRQEAAGRVARFTAHEINNILQSLTVNLYFAREATSLNPQISNDLAEAEKATVALQGLAQQLRALGRASELVPVSVRADELFLGAVDGWRTRSHVAVKTTPHHAALPKVMADAVAVRQSIEAILDNAVRYSGLTPPVTSVGADLVATDPGLPRDLPAAKTGVFARLWIANEGHRFAPETRHRAWDPYFSTRENQRSAGHGLALVWRVISALGGFAHIHEVATGARVSLFLPVIDPASENVAAARSLADVLATEG